jgi:hypothetical protein
MKKYYWTQQWDAQRMTCAELVTILERQGGFPGCMGGREFVESSGDEPIPIADSWDWIQSQRKNKKLWVLSHVDSDGEFIDA